MAALYKFGWLTYIMEIAWSDSLTNMYLEDDLMTFLTLSNRQWILDCVVIWNHKIFINDSITIRWCYYLLITFNALLIYEIRRLLFSTQIMLCRHTKDHMSILRQCSGNRCSGIFPIHFLQHNLTFGLTFMNICIP